MKKLIPFFGKLLFLFSLIGCLFLASSCLKQFSKKKAIIAGTYLEVTSSSPQAPRIVFNEFSRLNKIFNAHDPQSELSRLNAAVGIPVKISDELLEAFTLAQQVSALTQGASDRSGSLSHVLTDARNRTATIKKKGLRIDLDAIAKGYILDKAVLKLKVAGMRAALINAGGDTYCLGVHGKRPWRVGIADPREMQGVIETETLIDEAMATSVAGGKTGSSLIDRGTGLPAENKILSVTVIALNATTAKSLATAFCAMGLEKIKYFLIQKPSTMRVFVVTRDGNAKKVHLLR